MDIMTTSEVILQVITTRFNCQLVVLHVGNWYAWFQKPHANILIDIVTLLVSIYYRDQEPITCRDYNLNIAQYYVCVVCVHVYVCVHSYKYRKSYPQCVGYKRPPVEVLSPNSCTENRERSISHETCKLQCHRNRGIDIRVFHLLCRQWLQLSLQWNGPHHQLVCPIPMPSIECGAGLRIILQ